MSQNQHILIAMFIWLMIWHNFLKNVPRIKKNMKELRKIILRLF